MKKSTLSLSLLLLVCQIIFAQVPVISSFSPSSGTAGTVVKITGQNFDANKANNVVWFGQTKVSVNESTTSELSITIPTKAVSGAIKVFNTSTGLYGTSSSKFAFTTNPYPILPTNFEKRVDFEVNALAMKQCMADIDGDGKTDVVLVYDGPGNCGVLLRQANPTLTSVASFSSRIDLGVQAYNVIAEDFDGDGKQDLILQGPDLRVLRNLSTPGNVNFAPPQSISSLIGITNARIADVNGDGKFDLVAIHTSSPLISVWINNSTKGRLSFGARVDFSAPKKTSNYIVIEDLNGDQKPDVIVNNEKGLFIFKNNFTSGPFNNQSFVLEQEIDLGDYNNTFAIGDLDNDQKPDIVSNNFVTNKLILLQNLGKTNHDFVFGNKYTMNGIGNASSNTLTFIADMNGDGRPDILTATQGAQQSIAIYENILKTGTPFSAYFKGYVSYRALLYIKDLQIDDVDGDGRNDLVFVDNTLNILRNAPLTPPKIDNFTPKKGLPGSQVTISGADFNEIQENNLVYFGQTAARIVASTPNTITVEVPKTGKYRKIKVINKENDLSAFSSASFVTMFPSKKKLDDGDFKAKATLGSLGYGLDGTIADLDGDDIPDVIATSASNRTLYIYKYNATGGNISGASLAPRIELKVSGEASKVIVEDLNNDGRPEIIVYYNWPSSQMSIFQNLSTKGILNAASFGARIDLSTGTKNAIIDDIDLDGRPDIVFDDAYFGQGIGVCRNVNNGAILTDRSFEGPTLFSFDKPTEDFTVNEFTGKNKKDIFLCNANQLVLMSNTSTPGRISYGKTTFPFTGFIHLTSADLDEDGIPELIGWSLSRKISIFRITKGPENNVNLVLDYTIATKNYIKSLVLEDFDGDGLIDIGCTSDVTTVIRNNSVLGKIDFDDQKEYGVLSSNFATGDINQDGRPDLIVCSSELITLYQNDPVAAAPVLQPIPIITGFDLGTAKVGEVISINGSNFSSNARDHIVNVGGVNASVVGSTSNQIKIKIPTGSIYQPVNITNRITNLSATSTVPIVTKFGKKTDILATDFAADKTVRIYSSFDSFPQLLDVDGNGRPDIIHDRSIQLNMLDEFGKQTYITKEFPDVNVYAVGDLNGDGKPDLIQGNQNYRDFTVSLNTSAVGNVSVVKSLTYSCTLPAKILVRDVTGDGRQDLILVYADYFSVVQNLSIGSTIILANPVSLYGNIIGVADIDGDGKNDIVTFESVYRNISNNKGVLFAGATPTPHATDIADLDCDGKPDLISTGFTGKLMLSKNISTPGQILFETPTETPTPFYNRRLTTGDLNGDGKPDLIVSAYMSNEYAVFLNTSTNKLSLQLAIHSKPVSKFEVIRAHIVDWDMDGKNDILMDTYNSASPGYANSESYVLLKNIMPDGLRISSISPEVGIRGTVVTLTGTDLNKIKTISFGGTMARSFKIVSSTSVEAVVDQGAGGEVKATSDDDEATYHQFTFIPHPVILASGPVVFNDGGNVVLTASTGPDYAYKWFKNDIEIPGANQVNYTATSSGTYSVTLISGSYQNASIPVMVTAAFHLPATNFKLAVTSLTCKGSKNGSIAITAVQQLNYVATLSIGSTIISTMPFTDKLDINSLASGNYSICITIPSLPGFSRCFDVVVAEPKDLELYAAVNQVEKTVTLALSGGKLYTILLNDQAYTTTSNSIVLPLKKGLNTLTLHTDLVCQGTIDKRIMLGQDPVPYPNPFEKTFSIDLVDDPSRFAKVEIRDVTGRLVYSKNHQHTGFLEIDPGDLSAGIYVLKITTPKLAWTFKILKK